MVWRLEDQTLTRDESLKSAEDLTLRRWWVALPTTAARNEILFDGGQRRDRFTSDSCALEVWATADWPLTVALSAAGDGALSRGARGPVPLHLVYESRGLRLAAGRAARWRVTLKVEGENR